tara:strand:- start:6568 stop:6756 length:189 start_codon:yes stop_codon:yes gene_type:complete
MLSNPVPRSSLFATLDMEELVAFVEGTKNPSESAQVLYFALNYAHDLVDTSHRLNNALKSDD